MKTRVEIKTQAKDLIKANYGTALLPYLIYAIIGSAISSMTFGLGAILMLPLFVGMCMVYILLWKDEKPQITTMFNVAFQENFVRKLGGMLWMYLFTFLWSLLFMIPGIVKTYSYAMTPYILAKYPNVDAKSALKLSMKIMNGRKMDLFVVDLSFIGWYLLGVITFGIALIFYVTPYMQVTRAGCFDEYVADALAKGTITEADLGL